MSEPHTFTEEELRLAYPSVNEKELMELSKSSTGDRKTSESRP